MWGNHFQQSVIGAEMFWTRGKDFLTFDQFCRVPATQFSDVFWYFRHLHSFVFRGYTYSKTRRGGRKKIDTSLG